MIHVKGYLETKKVQGVHILIGGFMEPNFIPFFNIFDPSSNASRYWGNGDEVMQGTTYDNAVVTLDPKATGIVRCKMSFRGCIASAFANERQQSGRTNVQKLARSFETIYRVEPTLDSRDFLEDLYKMMHELRKRNPADINDYMSM